MADSTATAKTAADMLAAQCDERLPFFFQHYDHDVATDEPGLLVGAAGIALALADRACLPAPEVPTAWTAVLLLPTPVSLPALNPDRR